MEKYLEFYFIVFSAALWTIIGLDLNNQGGQKCCIFIATYQICLEITLEQISLVVIWNIYFYVVYVKFCGNFNQS